MAYTRQYTEGVGWQNSPSLATPLNATNLNKMDDGIKNVDEAVAEEFESVEQALSNLEDDAVTDVMVGGTSVVSGGVAEIPAIPTVISNPSGTGSADLTKLQVGNTVYDVPSGGGGTTVVANPSGAATDDLEKIQIGNTIYDIPSGGGASVYMSDYYDTEERVVGRWTDGKPLYQKTIHIDSPIRGSWTSVSLSGLSVDKMPHLFGGYLKQWSSGGAYVPFTYYEDSSKNGTLRWRPDTGNLEYICNDSSSNTIVSADITVQYTKTTDAPGTGPTAGNIIYLPALYSEEEREVGVWTDGKPLYQKTWVFANQVSVGASWSDIPITKADYNFEHIISAISSDALGTNNKIMVAIDDVSKTVVRGYACRNSSLSIKNLTLQYTKTTDTPGSGTWTPDGQLAHHYSTSEHIVGTWIDGSTLYERTWDFGSNVSLTANNWYDTSISNSGISLLTNVEAISANGNFRGQIEGSVNSSGSYIQLRSDGIASSVRYVTLRYTKA